MNRYLVSLSAAAMVVSCVCAAEIPCAQMKIVVPYPPGGSNDYATRIVGERLEASLKKNVLVEYRPGASGNIGTASVVAAKPDGCTLLMNGAVIATFPYSFEKLGYDPINDLVPVGGIGESPTVLVTSPMNKINDVMALAQWGRGKPDGLTFSTAGYGLLQHLAAEEIAVRTGAKFVHAPYKGGVQSTSDLMAGRVDFGSLSAGSITSFIQSGALKAVAVIQNKRSALLPDVPTIVEQGMAPLNAAVLYMMFAPARTPRDVVGLLSDELIKIINDASVRERLMRGGFDPAPLSSDESARVMRETAQTWAPVVKRLQVRLR